MGGRIGIAIFLLLCAGTSLWARQEQTAPEIVKEQELVINGEPVRMIQHQGGALCVVCGNAIHAHDRMYLIHGQRVAVHGLGSPCDIAFRKNAEKFLAALQPHGAFLGGEPARNISLGWFYAGMYVLAGLIFAGLCGQRALERGHPQLQWFLAGLFLNVMAYALLRMKAPQQVVAPAGVPAGLAKIASTYDPVTCVCGAENHPAAKQCSTCGRELKPQVVSEVERAHS
jgi:hypothetical protein